MIAYREEEMPEAWARIGLTDDGRRVRAQLAALLMQGPPMGLQDGALREAVGRLTFARELVTLLDGPDVGRRRATDDPAVTLVRGKPAEPVGRGSRPRVPDADD